MTKERLRKYQTIKREADQIRGQIDTLKLSAYAPRVPSLDGVPSSGGGGHSDPVGDAVVKLAELRARYDTKLAELLTEQLAIETAIDRLDGVHRMLLRYKYIDGLPWEEVCLKINYSWRQTHRLHAQALEMLRREETEQ